MEELRQAEQEQETQTTPELQTELQQTELDSDKVPYVDVIFSPYKFSIKPNSYEMASVIKEDFRESKNVIRIRVDNLLEDVSEKGSSLIPAVCYREGGYGTYIDEKGKERLEFNESNDFQRQNLFMIDVDNSETKKEKVKGRGSRSFVTKKTKIENPLTIRQALDILEKNGLAATAIYETFSSRHDFQKFRIALVSDTYFTDKTERDAVMIGLISLFGKAVDMTCKDAVRAFFGSNSGCIYRNWTALCSRENLLRLMIPEPTAEDNAKEQKTDADKTENKDSAAKLEALKNATVLDDDWVNEVLALPIDLQIGLPIPDGCRNKLLSPFALECLKAYGDTDMARKLYNLRCMNCETPEEKKVLNTVYSSAQKRFHKDIEGDPNWTPPRKKKIILTPAAVEKALKDLDITVKFNVISRKLEISDLPTNSTLLPDAYKCTESKTTRRKGSEALLISFLTAYLKDKGYMFSSDLLEQNISGLAVCNSRNPFIDAIKACPWDGRDRVYETAECLGISAEGCRYMPYYEKWLLQVIAMACNDDGIYGNEFVLVLQGPQGIAKTSFFRNLAVKREWFAEGKDIDTNNKDSIIEATAILICELGELDATLVREQLSLKNFITRANDRFRPPYGKTAQEFPRRTSFCATVNPEEFLRDPTGSRRFVIIPVQELNKPFIFETMTPDYCLQLWAQVYEQYQELDTDCFRLNDEEMTWSEAQNKQRNVMVDGEIEIFDKLDFSRPIEEWRWYTNTEVSEAILGLCSRPTISSTRLGKALASVMARDKRVKKKHAETANVYLLPPKRTGFEPVNDKGVFEN